CASNFAQNSSTPSTMLSLLSQTTSSRMALGCWRYHGHGNTTASDSASAQVELLTGVSPGTLWKKESMVAVAAGKIVSRIRQCTARWKQDGQRVSIQVACIRTIEM